MKKMRFLDDGKTEKYAIPLTWLSFKHNIMHVLLLY